MLEKLKAACAVAGKVKRIENRTGVLRSAARPEVALVILPVFDDDDTPTAPLIAELHARDVSVAVCLVPASSSRGLADAMRAGAAVLTLEGASDLGARVTALLRRSRISEEERLALSNIVQDLSPLSLREMLVHCTAFAHERLTVAGLAADLGVSSRTLCRVTSQAGWPAPAEIILWGRIFRAALARWDGVEVHKSLARVSGFANPHALHDAAARRLRVCDDMSRLTPLRVSQALQRRLRGSALPRIVR